MYRYAPNLYVSPQLGMGACCGSCAHGGQCEKGMGLFDSGMDFTQWGWAEWTLAVIGGYAVVSMFQTTSRGVRAVREFPEGARRAVKRGRKKLGQRIAGE